MQTERECETCGDAFETSAMSGEDECRDCRYDFEAVGAILEEYDEEHVGDMLSLVRGGDVSLDYDAWTEPLRLDSRLAIELRSPNWKGCEYVYYNDGFRMWPLGLDWNVGDKPEDGLRDDIEAESIEINPVLTENTPLSEDSE